MKDIIENTINNCSIQRRDIYIVGRPELIHELRKANFLPSDVRIMMTSKIREYGMVDGRFYSNLHFVHKDDLWMYRDKTIRQKLRRAFLTL